MTTTAQLSENSHQGFDGIKAGLCLGSMEANPNTASEMPLRLRPEGIRSRSSGKERDEETGLDFFLARYYSGAQGRFLSPDEFKGGPDDALTGKDITPPGPLPYADIGNPQSINKYAYVINNPMRYTDPDGHSWWDVINGAANAFSTNFFGGVGRQHAPNSDYAKGQVLGDVAAVMAGGIETIVGAGGEVGGLALDLTGAGAVIGVPVQVVSTAAIVQGGAAVVTGATHLMKSSGPKAADAPGVTAGGQATDKYGNKIGPSGEPQINTTKSNTREAARNKALNEASGAVEHGRPQKGSPHFHPANKKGTKKPNSAHYEYPE